MRKRHWLQQDAFTIDNYTEVIRGRVLTCGHAILVSCLSFHYCPSILLLRR